MSAAGFYQNIQDIRFTSPVVSVSSSLRNVAGTVNPAGGVPSVWKKDTLAFGNNLELAAVGRLGADSRGSLFLLFLEDL